MSDSPAADEFGVVLEHQSVGWLASEVRLARYQAAAAERQIGGLALRLAQAEHLLKGLACIVRRLPKRPKVDQGRADECAAIDWVTTADYHTTPSIPWRSKPPSWAPPKPQPEAVEAKPTVEVVELPLGDVA